MNYFKSQNGDVFAYHKEDITQTERLTELEKLIEETEPVLAYSREQLFKKKSYIEGITLQRGELINESDIHELDDKIIIAIKEYENLFSTFSHIEEEYQSLKIEYGSILQVFFDIRENLKSLKEMTTKEIEAHLNPPTSKEQLIAEAEMQKQSYVDEAERRITILERKVRLEMATGGEIELLKQWEIYSVKVSGVDTSKSPDMEWPATPI